MVDQIENGPRFLKLDLSQEEVYRWFFRSLPRRERNRVWTFLSSHKDGLSKIFRQYQHPEHIQLFSNLTLEKLLSDRQSSFQPDKINLRKNWNAICGVFFEPLATYYIRRMFEREYTVVPGGKVGASWRSPDAFLIRDIQTAFVVCGAFEYKFGVTTYEQEEKLAHQLSNLDDMKPYFESPSAHRRLAQFLGESKDIIINPKGYVRKFLVTPKDFREPELPGVTTFKLPLSKVQISDMCAASLVDFSVFQGRVVLSN